MLLSGFFHAIDFFHKIRFLLHCKTTLPLSSEPLILSKSLPPFAKAAEDTLYVGLPHKVTPERAAKAERFSTNRVAAIQVSDVP
jgi:hypothetical protein